MRKGRSRELISGVDVSEASRPSILPEALCADKPEQIRACGASAGRSLDPDTTRAMLRFRSRLRSWVRRFRFTVVKDTPAVHLAEGCRDEGASALTSSVLKFPFQRRPGP